MNRKAFLVLLLCLSASIAFPATMLALSCPVVSLGDPVDTPTFLTSDPVGTPTSPCGDPIDTPGYPG